MAVFNEPPDPVNKPMDKETINLLNKVTNQINTQNQKIIGFNTNYQLPTIQGLGQTLGTQAIQPVWYEDPIAVEPSPNIDMENPIYANEFEECGNVEIGTDDMQHAKLIGGIYIPPVPACAQIGLIDDVSEDEDDLYAKLPDGEIIPFEGHTEKFSVEIFTWNDLQRSDLIGNAIKKAATCHIMINDKLARIIEGTDIQDLLMKADRAISELKVQPFSIARDAYTLIGKEIYYDNQPAIISNIDEVENLIYIIPDPSHLNNFIPPAYAIEDNDEDEWTTKFGSGMLIRDYDEKIWWWRNNTANIDPNDDPYYKQFPQPLQPPLNPPNPGSYPVPGITTMPPWTQVITTTPYISPYATTGGNSITWTAGDTTVHDNYAKNTFYTYIDPVTSAITITELTDSGDIVSQNKITAKEQIEATTPDLNKIITDKANYSKNDKRMNDYFKYKTKKPIKKIKGPIVDKVIIDEIVEQEEPF